MAPERFNGWSDPRTDVYSVGITLYEMLLLQPGFEAPDRLKLIHKVTHEEPPRPRKQDSGIPRDLETIVLKAIDKEPGRRYQTAAELAEDLRRFVDDRPIQARRISGAERTWRWCKRNPALASLAAALLIVLLAGAGISTYFAIQAEQRAAEALAARDRADAKAEDAFAEKQRADAEAGRAKEKAAEAVEAMNKVRQAHAVSLLRQAQVAWRDNNARHAGALLQEVPADLRGWEWNYLKRLYRGGYLTLYGHTGPVSSVTMSPDGARLATGSWDRTAKVWDAVTGRELLTLKGHTGRLFRVAFSPDGRRLATGSEDRTVRIWDAVTGRELVTLKGHTDTVLGVAFSSDGKRLATASSRLYWLSPQAGEEWAGKVWDAVTGRELFTLKGHNGRVYDVAFSPDGHRLATGSDDKTAKVWDAVTGREVLTLKGHTSTVYGVAFSPDGQRLATAGVDQTAKVWDVRTGQELLTLRGQTPYMNGVAFSPDGQRLATASGDGTAKVWDARTGQEILTLKGHTSNIWGVSFSSDGQRLATASGDGTAKVWDVRGQQEAFALQGYRDGVRSVAFSPDGQRLATSSADRTARVWDVLTGKELLSIVAHAAKGATPAGVSEDPGGVEGVAFSPDGQRLATTGWDNTAKVWDAHTGQLQLTLRGHTRMVIAVAFSPDGQRLATASWDGTAKVWDARSAKELIPPLAGHTKEVWFVAFSPDGHCLATASADRIAKVWDAHTGRFLFDIKGHTSVVSCVAFSPDGQRIATASLDSTAKLWDARTGRLLFDLKGHIYNLLGVAFSPDSRRLASVGNEHAVKIWDTITGQELLTLTGASYDGRHGLRNVVFSPDGQRLATAGHYNNGRAEVWDARPIAEPLALRGHTGPVFSAAFSSDGRHLATGSIATVRIWDARTCQEVLPPREHPGGVFSVAFSPDGKLLAGAGDHGTTLSGGIVKIWDVRTGRELHSFKGTALSMIRVVFSPDGERLATISKDWTTKVWDLRTEEEVADPNAGEFALLAQDPALSPDERLLARPDGEVVYFHDLKQVPDAEDLAYRQAIARLDPVWQEEQAARHEPSGQWFAVAFHLDQAQTARPDLPLHLRRGRARAELAQWTGAETDFAEAVRQEPDAIAAWRGLGLTQLVLGHEEAFRQTCDGFRARFAAMERSILTELYCLAALPLSGGRSSAALIGTAAFEVRLRTLQAAAYRPSDPARSLTWSRSCPRPAATRWCAGPCCAAPAATTRPCRRWATAGISPPCYTGRLQSTAAAATMPLVPPCTMLNAGCRHPARTKLTRPPGCPGMSG
jgi:WD40 repeat protein